MIGLTVQESADVCRGWRGDRSGESEGVGSCLAALVLPVLFLAPGAVPLAAEPPSELRPPDPVPLRLLSPIHLLFYQLPPVSAATLGHGIAELQIDVSESNAIHPRREIEFTFRGRVNYELPRVAFTYRRGVSDRLDVGFELPVYFPFGGFLDEVVTETERFVGALKPRRDNEEAEGRQHLFDYRLFVGDELLVFGRDHALELGDLGVFLKRSLEPRPGRPAMALRAGLKIPTGDPFRGLGSGEVDAVAGVAVSWDLGRWTVHAGGQMILPVADFQDVPGLTAIPQLAFHLDGAYSRWRRLTLHAQMAAVTPAFETDHEKVPGGVVPTGRPPGGDDTFEGHVIQVTPAVSWRFGERGDRTVFVGIAEDFGSSENTAFDVTFFASFRWRPSL